MNKLFARLNWKHRLMLATFVLGLVAVIIGTPNAASRAVVDTRALALAVQNEADHVTVAELADWLIADRADYRLLDLRTEPEFAEYHIPGAEHVAIASLDDADLKRNDKLVLYSAGGIHAAQAWFLLKARGFASVYLLQGGLEEWQDQILFPRLAETATAAEKVAFEKTRQISLHFGGSPQTGGTDEAPAVKKALPRLESPAGGAAPAGGGKKKKKEGC